MNTYIIILAAGCALLLSFVLGVIVTDRIYQRVYDRSEEREAPSPLSGTESPGSFRMTGTGHCVKCGETSVGNGVFGETHGTVICPRCGEAPVGTGNRVPGAMTGEDAEPSAASGLTEEEKRRYEEERKAFDDCMKYNIDQAYGTAGKHGGA